MVQELVVTLREGGETSLMLALLFSALKAAGHSAYRIAAWVGFLIALALSIAAGFALRDLGSLGPLFEASLAWIGAGFVASLAIQLHGSTSHRSQLPLLQSSAASKHVSWAALFAIGSFAFVSVIREGLETAVFLSSSGAFQSQGAWLGAAVGLALAAGLGFSIYFGFRRLHLRAFMRTTEILLFALVFSLFLTGAAEFAEAGLLTLPTSLRLFHEGWVKTGASLQLLLCVAPFLYIWLARAPFRDLLRAAAIAAVLAVTPSLLGAAARLIEHARMAPSERAATSWMEATVLLRASRMTRALETLGTEIRRGSVDRARMAWIDARTRFVELEPYLALMDPEAAEELNGEPGEAVGFHGVEEQLFQAGAPWAKEPNARTALLAKTSELRVRAKAVITGLQTEALSPARVRAAWVGHRWTFLGRLDGQESAASQTSVLEIRATLDAMDADLENPSVTAEIRAALLPAFKAAQGGPRYGEHEPETTVSLAAIHQPLRVEGPDRGFYLVDRVALRRATASAFDRLAAIPEPL